MSRWMGEDGDPESLVAAAVQAHRTWSRTPRTLRAEALVTAAGALDTAADELVAVGRAETRLAEPRLRAELQRTTFQLRLFADVLVDGGFLDVRVDHADPAWPMGPRPDLRCTAQALGPVIVYAASNFPFAFSVAGGDTASALAAGASVIVKAHAGHPELSLLTMRVLAESLRGSGAPDGVVALVRGRDDGIRILRDPRVKAGSFTGSISGGRALFDIASSRPEPIPFFGELGSVNPVFVTTEADRRRGADIARELLASATLGSGQFCTKPGLLLVPKNSVTLGELRTVALPAGQPMLNDRIHQGYAAGLSELLAHPSVEVLSQGDDPLGAAPSPTLLLTDLDALLDDRDELFRECFGPTVLVARCADDEDLLRFARCIDGQLTATVVAEPEDEVVPALIDELRERAGRLLWNQWPTGVSVTFAQQHGGPYPATTSPHATSVGTAAITRFLRPVAFQGFPHSLLPDELRDEPDSVLVRRVDGTIGSPPER